MNKNIDKITEFVRTALRNDEYDDLNILNIFLIFFKRIPKYKRDVRKVSIKFYKHLLSNADHINSTLYDDTIQKSFHGRHIFYYKDSLISFFKDDKDEPYGTVTFATDDPHLEEEIFKNTISQKKKKKVAYFGIVLQNSSHGSHGLDIKKFPLEMPEISIGLNYGEDFINKNEMIMESLANNHHGLYLFHGPPGTGKTTYIKHLAYILGDTKKPEPFDTYLSKYYETEAFYDKKPLKSKEKLFIYLPTQLMNSVTDPSFASLLLNQNNDIILILEDAEEYLRSREEISNHSAVATLLNLTDGIMGSILNVSIIVTFNVETGKIDEALKRKGRLFAEHRFDKLNTQDAQKLLNNLKIDYKTKKPMSLAEIYNFELENFAKQSGKKKRIGFGT